MKHKIFGYVFIILVASAVVAGIYHWQKLQQQPIVVPVQKDDAVEFFCGGLAGIPCPTTGYTCKAEGNFPDAGTYCKKD